MKYIQRWSIYCTGCVLKEEHLYSVYAQAVIIQWAYYGAADKGHAKVHTLLEEELDFLFSDAEPKKTLLSEAWKDGFDKADVDSDSDSDLSSESDTELAVQPVTKKQRLDQIGMLLYQLKSDSTNPYNRSHLMLQVLDSNISRFLQ